MIPDAAPVSSLRVGGMTPFSTSDYPGQMAAVLFVQGCPWRCGYCHNPHLQERGTDNPLDWGDIMKFLKRRAGLIDAVVFSGGEPTIDPALEEAMQQVKALGYKIGLHCAGIYPRRLKEVLPLVDWVGLDIKATFNKYAHITQFAGSGDQALACLQAVLASGVDYELRTTLHPLLLPEEDLLELARSLAKMKVNNYVWQLFRDQGCNDAVLNNASLAGYPSESLVEQVSAMFTRFTLKKNA